jgi:hypothetical protein
MKKALLSFLFTFLITLCFGQKNPKTIVPVKKPMPMPALTNARALDTFFKPIEAVTLLNHREIAKYLRRLDMIDGTEDSTIKDFQSLAIDEQLNNFLYKGAKHAAMYIENETFDKNVMQNFQLKKKYLGQVKNNLSIVLDNFKSKKYPLDSILPIFTRLEDIAQATAYKNEKTYLAAQQDMATYLNKDLFSADSAMVYQITNTMCKNNPEIMGTNLKELRKYENYCSIVNYLATNKSNTIMNYVLSTSSEKDIILNCPNPLIQSMKLIAEQSKFPLRATAMLGELQSGVLTITQVDSIASKDELYFKKLIQLHQKDEQVSKNVITRDLKIAAVEYVRQMNELHEKSDAVRFACLDKLGVVEMYYICVLGSEEIYTSSYLGTYKRLMNKLKPKNGFELIQLAQNDRFRTFIRMCANYNTLPDFLSTMATTQKLELMDAFVGGLGNTKVADLEGAVDVADSYGSLSDPELIDFLRQKVQFNLDKYTKAGSVKAVNIYKILNSLFSQREATNPELQQELKLPSLTKVDLPTLYFDSAKTIYEQMFFYGDDDGKVGYRSFLGTFDRKQWTIDDSQPEWIKISSKNTKVPMVIFANKPLDEPNDEFAQLHLLDYLINQDIHPTIMVHRGHSYHLKSTIGALNGENKIVILGSCGGYQNLNEIIRRAPDAHIISTKQVGVFKVNTPIIAAVHSAVTAGEDVDWISIWTKLTKQFKGTASESFFNDYVPPHKNLGSLFLKAYARLEGED